MTKTSKYFKLTTATLKDGKFLKETSRYFENNAFAVNHNKEMFAASCWVNNFKEMKQITLHK